MFNKSEGEHLRLIFLGNVEYVELLLEADLTLARQLADETLVAAVDMLRVLELLERVNVDEDVPALDMVLVEERQLLEAIELALEAGSRPLRLL